MSDTIDERLAALEEKFHELAAAVTADAQSGSRDAVKAFDHKHGESIRYVNVRRAEAAQRDENVRRDALRQQVAREST